MVDGKRNTLQRQLILSAVEELNIHASAEQVFEFVVRRHPAISKATVYRNLAQMAETGELLNIGNFFGATHYDHNLHEHYHFACEKCRKIFDVDGDFASIIGKVKTKEGFDIKNCWVSLSGLCGECKTG